MTECKSKESHVIVITTGGTIEKIYDEKDGLLKNKGTLVEAKVINLLELPYTKVESFSIFSKDSLDITDDDRLKLKNFILDKLKRKLPIIIVHGTDTMEVSVKYCEREISEVPVPVIFTGAMRPLDLKNTDAFQNIAEAFLASKILSPGFYISFHGHIFNTLKVRKNKAKGIFENC